MLSENTRFSCEIYLAWSEERSLTTWVPFIYKSIPLTITEMRIKYSSVSCTYSSHMSQWFWALWIVRKQIFHSLNIIAFQSVISVILYGYKNIPNLTINIYLYSMLWIIWNYQVVGILMVNWNKGTLINSYTTSCLLCCGSTFEQEINIFAWTGLALLFAFFQPTTPQASLCDPIWSLHPYSSLT